MLHKKLNINVNNSNVNTRLEIYIIDESSEIEAAPRPLILMCPGGGYYMTSDREAEIMGLQFLSKGYNVAILRYSCSPATYPTQVTEVLQAFNIILNNAKKWNVDANKIIIQGCSAGAHLALHYAVAYEEIFDLALKNEDFLKNAKKNFAKESYKPCGVMLSYPVVTSGKYAHKGSFENLLGKPYDKLTKTKELENVSLEKRIHKNVPPVFVWHTFEDGVVPVQNSLLLVNALVKNNVHVEYHLFPEGGHGLGLASKITKSPYGNEIQEECQQWINLAINWANKLTDI